MSATLPLSIFQKFTDSNNLPLAGGKLYFYQAGTLVPQAAYSDSTGSTPLSNPVILDANGQTNFWLKGGQTYKINLTSSADVQQPQFPIDNIIADSAYTILPSLANSSYGDALIGVIQSYTGSVASTQHQLNQSALSILGLMTAAQYAGWVANPITYDMTAIVQAAITANPGATIHFPAGTWLIGSISQTCNTRWVGDGWKFTKILFNAGASNPLINNITGDFNFTASDIEFNGNGVAQVGFAVAVGSLTLEQCWIHDFGTHAINTGNAELGTYNLLTYAHDVTVEDCIISQGSYFTGSVSGSTLTLQTDATGSFGTSSILQAAGVTVGTTITAKLSGTMGKAGSTYSLSTTPGTIASELMVLNQGYMDCIRIFRTQRATIARNFCIGGDSSIRTQDYCSNLMLSGNYSLMSWNDVGITVTLSVDVAIIGNVCQGHFHHGIEANSCKRVVISGNICTGNGTDASLGGNGILVEYYAPPSGTNYSGYWDGLLVTSATSATLLVNQDYVVSGNVLANNSKFGLQIGSTNGALIFANKIRGNCTGNNVSWYAGIYLTAGTGVSDNVQISGNSFENTGYQTASITRSSPQNSVGTVIKNNSHIGGLLQVDGAPAFGSANAMIDRFLSKSTTIASGATTIECATSTPAAISASGFVRRINDASSGSQTTVNFSIPYVARYGSKLVHIRLRTPDTMTSCTIAVTTWKTASQVGTPLTPQTVPLTTTYQDYTFLVVNSVGSTDYDEIQIQIKTDLTLVGNIDVEQINAWMPCE